MQRFIYNICSIGVQDFKKFIRFQVPYVHLHTSVAVVLKMYDYIMYTIRVYDGVLSRIGRILKDRWPGVLGLLESLVSLVAPSSAKMMPACELTPTATITILPLPSITWVPSTDRQTHVNHTRTHLLSTILYSVFVDMTNHNSQQWFYGTALLKNFTFTAFTATAKFKSCYHEFLEHFFGYLSYSSVTTILFELGLPSFDTLLHYYKVSFYMTLGRYLWWKFIGIRIFSFCLSYSVMSLPMDLLS